MTDLTRDDLWSLEQYSEERTQFRTKVLAHKVNRKLFLGGNIQLLFEDRLTIQYQIQEMLRIEKIFEVAAIEEELAAYNPLIPTGDNWKCTMLIQYQDADERKRQLAALMGIEDKIWFEIGDEKRVYAIADEDMERSNEQKTSAVHFLRFPLDSEHVQALQADKTLVMGVDHPAYRVDAVVVPDAVKLSLKNDIK